MSILKIDVAHSEVSFKIKHLMISNVRGYFNNFDGEINLPSEDFTKAEISFTGQINSISTNNEMRDNHLKSDEFFDVEKFPTITFKSKNINKEEDNKFMVTGDFTMHGVTKEINLHTILNGTTKDLYGSTVVSFEISSSISRKDFELNWNSPLETGGMVLSDEVKIEINAEFKEIK